MATKDDVDVDADGDEEEAAAAPVVVVEEEAEVVEAAPLACMPGGPSRCFLRGGGEAPPASESEEEARVARRGGCRASPSCRSQLRHGRPRTMG